MTQIKYYAKGFVGITAALVILSGVAYSAFIMSTIIFTPICSLIFTAFAAICAILLCARAIKYACTDTTKQQQKLEVASKPQLSFTQMTQKEPLMQDRSDGEQVPKQQTNIVKIKFSNLVKRINNIIDNGIFGNRSNKTNAVISLFIGGAVGAPCAFLGSNLISLSLSPFAVFGIIAVLVSAAWFLTSYNASKYNGKNLSTTAAREY